MSSKDNKRLPTFKAQRDLTLGSRKLPTAATHNVGGRNRSVDLGSASKRTGLTSLLGTHANSLTASGDSKRKFVPNLNVQRRQPQNESVPSVKQENTIPNLKGRKSYDNSKREDRKPFKQPEYIQTMGAIFSEGIGDGKAVIRRSKYGGGGSRSNDGETSSNMHRPKLNMNVSLDKEAEAERLKELLRDDFIDDLTQGPLVPVQLPMIDTGTAFKEEDIKDLNIKEESKGEKSKNSRRILDSDDDSDNDSKQGNKLIQGPESISSQKSVIGKAPPTKPSDKGKASKITFKDLVQMQKGDLLFVQLPDHLPGNVPKPNQAVKEENPYPGINADESMDIDDSSSLTSSLKCSLNSLPEGYLGKIQIRKSGKTQMIIGDTALDIDLGTQVGFLQDLVSINLPEQEQETVASNQKQTGDMTVLGHVRHRIVVSPDWERLFDLSGKQSKVNSANRNNDEDSSDSDDEIYNQKVS